MGNRAHAAQLASGDFGAPPARPRNRLGFHRRLALICVDVFVGPALVRSPGVGRVATSIVVTSKWGRSPVSADRPSVNPPRSRHSGVQAARPLRGILCSLSLLLLAGAALAAEPIRARVASLDGRPTLFLNDRPTLPLIYALTHTPGARWSWEEVPQYSIAQFAQRGVRLFQADLWLEQLWTAEDRFDIARARRQIRGDTLRSSIQERTASPDCSASGSW